LRRVVLGRNEGTARDASLEFCPVLDELVRSRRVLGRSKKEFNNLGALSTKNTLYTLRQAMLDLNPERTLEVGMSFGGSCLALTATHRDLGHAPQRQHVSLDPFQSTVWDSCGIDAVERAGLAAFLDFRPERSSIGLPRLLSSGARFGLIYIDGSHLFEDVFVDGFFASRLLTERGIVVFDDSTNPHVHKAMRFIRNNLGQGLEEVDLSIYRPDRRRGIRYRIARGLRRVQLTAFRRVGTVDRDWNARYRSF
jgi:hypothetical protein